MSITIEELLSTAKEQNASDLHLTVGVPAKIRVNGDLISLETEPFGSEELKIMLLNLLSEWQKKALSKKGEVDFSLSIAELGRFRVNVFKQRGLYAAVIRLVGTMIPDAKELGVPHEVMDLCKKKRGLILVTGSNRSGKSTTLASFIDGINKTTSAHIITLENPIEYLHPHKKSVVNQREIGLDTISFANAIRVALHEDPDVIFVGELRDLDTIHSAIIAAESGHLVLSTLHTIGAVNTINRIVDVFPHHEQQQIRVQLAGVLEAVISQQLIPTSNQKGRIAAFEVMLSTPELKTYIQEGKSNQIITMIQSSRKLGMQTMDDAIFELYIAGTIDKENALIYAQNVAEMEHRIG